MEEKDDKKRLEYCPVCGWEDSEYLYNFPDCAGGANVMSLNEARKAWKEGKKVY